MKKGYTKAWRKELESDIWLMAPIYHRVWFWIRQKVQHEAYLFPTHKKFGIWVLSGQRITSYQQIAEGVKWHEWGQEKIPNKRSISAVIDWLMERQMITVESNAHGTLITITNWDIYNNASSAESNANETDSTPPSAHKKRMKKNEKEKNIFDDGFEKLWEVYPNKDGKKEALKHFRASVTTRKDCHLISYALTSYLDHLRQENWKKPKNGSTWFNNWRDWIPEGAEQWAEEDLANEQ